MIDSQHEYPKTSKGEQAYRWTVSCGMALICALSWRLLNNVDQMAAKIEDLQGKVNSLSATMAWAERRNDTQDVKIDALQQRVWQLPAMGRP